MKVTKITVLDQSEATIPGPEGKSQVATYLTLKDEAGWTGMVVILKKDPTDRDIAEAYKKLMEKRAAAKPREIKI